MNKLSITLLILACAYACVGVTNASEDFVEVFTDSKEPSASDSEFVEPFTEKDLTPAADLAMAKAAAAHGKPAKKDSKAAVPGTALMESVDHCPVQFSAGCAQWYQKTLNENFVNSKHTPAQCQAKCKARKDCGGFFINKEDGACLLVSAGCTASTDLRYNYYSMATCKIDIPSSYMKIACPVMRGLVGSGFIERVRVKSGTFIASASKTLQTIKNVLGFSEDAMKPFKGINKKKARDKSGRRQVNQEKDEWDLNAMHEFLGHAASTGIIGSATTGGAQCQAGGCKAGGAHDGGVPLAGGVCKHWCSQHGYCGKTNVYKNGGSDCSGDNDEFNKDRFDELMKLAGNGQFTPTQWGQVVNHFSHLGITGKNKGRNMEWSSNKLSWAILTLELSNTLAAFKNANMVGGTGSSISASTVRSLYQNGMLPSNFIPANGQERILPSTLRETVKSMGIHPLCSVVEDMREKAKAGPACPKPPNPEVTQCVTGMLQKNYCGPDFENCGGKQCNVNRL